MVATPSPSASPEPTLVLGKCAALLPLGQRPAPDILRDIRVPGDREGVRALVERLPRQIDGKPLQLPFVGPPEIFAARYGADATLVLNAKQLAPGETGLSAIEREVATTSASCAAGRDGNLVWVVLNQPGLVVIGWAAADGGWSFSAVAPDMARAEMLVAAYRDATGSRDGATLASDARSTMMASLAWASDEIVGGERQGYWRLTDNDTFTDLPAHYAAFERQPLASATTVIRDALLGEMPAGPIAGVAPVVSLDAAPLNPEVEE
ncbi:MAG TPA: hypothetical protein PLR44_15065 [Thermomicrobiales bacterium]|nr:hypothetical protein [Thermomicrobiales bacterium]